MAQMLKGLGRMINELNNLGNAGYKVEINIPAGIDNKADGAFRDTIEKLCDSSEELSCQFVMQPEADAVTISGPANQVALVLTAIQTLGNTEIDSSFTMSAGLLTRRFIAEVEFKAEITGLKPQVREYRGALGSQYLIKLHGPLADVAAFLSALDDAVAEHGGGRTLAQRRAGLLKAEAKSRKKAERAARPSRWHLRRPGARAQEAAKSAVDGTDGGGIGR